MSELRFYRPKFFTTTEGGGWHAWHPARVLTDPDLNKRGKVSVRFYGISVHSFAFDDPSVSQNYRRWDCVNGWTRR